MSHGDADTIEVRLNGEPRRVSAVTTVATLAEELGLRSGRFAVEIDGVVVPRSQHPERTLKPGEALEVVTFVGGG